MAKELAWLVCKDSLELSEDEEYIFSSWLLSRQSKYAYPTPYQANEEIDEQIKTKVMQKWQIMPYPTIPLIRQLEKAIQVVYNNTTWEFPRYLLIRLRMLHKQTSNNSVNIDIMNCLLRYEVINREEFYRSLPLSAWQVLISWGVDAEWMCSPFNCTLSEYQSPFLDIDNPFGAKLLNLQQGTYVVHVPLTIDMWKQLKDRMITALSTTDQPLTFIVVMSTVIDLPFCRWSYLYPADTHYYRIIHHSETHDLSPIDTYISILQNDAAFRTKPFTLATELHYSMLNPAYLK